VNNLPGTDIEAIYNLMTFGIPKDAIPVETDGSMNLTAHHSTLETLVSKERRNAGEDPIMEAGICSSSTNNNTSSGGCDTLVLLPGPMDVLMGRGRKQKICPGALILHNLLIEHREAYDTISSRSEKTELSKNLLKQMKASGSRFLNIVPGGYVECDDSVAREKISHGFRNLRLKDSTGATNGNDKRKGRKRNLPEMQKSAGTRN
jgi:hypothetical protein